MPKTVRYVWFVNAEYHGVVLMAIVKMGWRCVSECDISQGDDAANSADYKVVVEAPEDELEAVQVKSQELFESKWLKSYNRQDWYRGHS